MTEDYSAYLIEVYDDDWTCFGTVWEEGGNG